MFSSHEVNRRFGSALVRRREAAKMTQAQLAEASGLGRTTITNIEAGAQGVTLHQVLELARALKIEVGELIPDMATAERSNGDVERYARFRKSLLSS